MIFGDRCFISFMIITTTALTFDVVRAVPYNYLQSFTSSINSYISGTSNDAGNIYVNWTSGSIGETFQWLPIDFHSGDNFGKVSNLVNMLSLAIDSGALGDAVYLYHLINYNGYAQYISYENDSDFYNDVILDVRHTGGQVTYEDLASSTNSKDLAAFYRSLPPYPFCPTEQKLVVGEGVTCSNRHGAQWSSCDSLFSWLKSSGSVDITAPPRAYCKYGCCISWKRG
ncbi:hypothetical protein V1525DRAFT_413624 [Lipomyces kononenkoae]|uniref:Uncharacterized protein n=1 Tax=Lipomyces kononenkoae TaxID=34357 RepID=A0ACC3SRL8_LIPKO